MERFLQHMHYTAYRADYWMRRGLMAVNPIRPFALPWMRKRAKLAGKTVEEMDRGILDVFERRDWGMSIIFAGGFMGGIVFLFLDGVVTLVRTFTHSALTGGTLYALILGALSYAFCHFVLWRHDKDLKFFREFDKESLARKWVWALVTLAVTIGLVAFAVGMQILKADYNR